MNLIKNENSSLTIGARNIAHTSFYDKYLIILDQV